MAATFDWETTLKDVLPIALDIAIKLTKDALSGASTREEALSRLRTLDEQLSQTLDDMRGQLAANDAAEDARRQQQAAAHEETSPNVAADTRAQPSPSED